MRKERGKVVETKDKKIIEVFLRTDHRAIGEFLGSKFAHRLGLDEKEAAYMLSELSDKCYWKTKDSKDFVDDFMACLVTSEPLVSEFGNKVTVKQALEEVEDGLKYAVNEFQRSLPEMPKYIREKLKENASKAGVDLDKAWFLDVDY